MCASYNPSKTYPIDYSRPGVVIIFNNETFTKHPKRKGSEKDVSSLLDLFVRLNYDVLTYKNKNAADMRRAIRDYATKDYLSSVGCLLVFIMSHGNNGTIISQDSLEIDLDEFMNPLKTNKSLIGKPKLFFIQACRGGNLMSGIQTDDPFELLRKYHDNNSTLPVGADFLISFATVEGYMSLRDLTEGTWYIQMLCKAIERDERGQDISQVLRCTNRLISEMVAKICKCKIGECKCESECKSENGQTKCKCKQGECECRIDVKMLSIYEDTLSKSFYFSEPESKNLVKKNYFIFLLFYILN